MAVASSQGFPFCINFCLVTQCSCPTHTALPVWIHQVCTTTHETGRSLHLIGPGWQHSLHTGCCLVSCPLIQQLSASPFSLAVLCITNASSFDSAAVHRSFCAHPAHLQAFCDLVHSDTWEQPVEHGACDIWPPYMKGQDRGVSTSWCCRQRPATVCSVQWPIARRASYCWPQTSLPPCSHPFCDSFILRDSFLLLS
jgi:hypothetical protein